MLTMIFLLLATAQASALPVTPSSVAVVHQVVTTTVFTTLSPTESTSTITNTITSTTTLPPIKATATHTVLITPTPTTDTTDTKSTPSSTPAKAAWAAPSQMSDLSKFSISYYPYGQENVDVVSSIPLSAYRENPSVRTDAVASNSSMIRLRYPANSVNPSGDIQGGADFYSDPFAPGALEAAQTASLAYSIFFPADFDFVRGGKLPGLYGGHPACSGGNDAHDCFSTRLMWRARGQGELYLYVPKDKQSDTLCSTPPASHCNAEYGLSIGRGAFTFKRGDWTHVEQIVRLNTPGEKDGGFVLIVDGKEVINVQDIHYRGAPTPGKASTPKPTSAKPATHTSAVHAPRPTSSAPPQTTTPPESGTSDLLGDLLGGLLRREDEATIRFTLDGQIVIPNAVASSIVTEDDGPLEIQKITKSISNEPVGFAGLFFSTFFGGHDQEYASPREQFTYFKDFEMAILG